MATIPAKVRERLVTGIKRFQPILSAARSRDINESDTVTLVNDILAYVLGFDKYSEITSEFVIRGTYVDLAIKVDGQVEMLIEVKAVGLELKDAFVKQAVDYGANQGVEWVMLTTGVLWRVYQIAFQQPVSAELVTEINFATLNPKSDDDLGSLFMISKEGLGKSLLGEFQAQRQALNRYFMGAVLLSEPVVDVVRRELRRLSPDVKIDNDQIRAALMQDILKREVTEGEKADDARKRIARAMGRALRKANGKDDVASLPTLTPAESVDGGMIAQSNVSITSN